MRTPRWARLILVASFLCVAAVYVAGLPTTVQIGDTGELATAGAALVVPHPPGFPLFVWLEAFFLRLIPAGTVFWRASLLSALLGLGTLALLAATLAETGLAGAGFVAVVGFSRLLWRYSELPDVFALNAFLAALLLYLYFSGFSGRRRAIPFVFLVGLAAHPTLVFLFPVVLHALWEGRRDRKMLASLALGACAFVGLYASLMLLHPEDLASWGRLDSFRALVDHVLRRDYGLFKLSSGSETGSLLANLARLGAESLLAFYALLVAVAVTSRHRLTTSEWVVTGTAALYAIVFFALANTPIEGYRGEILDRFIILFEVMLAFLCASRLRVGLAWFPWKHTLGALLISCAGISFVQFQLVNDFSRNTIVEDQALNFLREIPAGEHAVLLLDTDTRFFAVRYAQVVLGVRPDVVTVSPATLIYPWYAEKLVRVGGLSFDLGRPADRKVGLQEELLEPNLARFSFLTVLPFAPSAAYQLLFMPLGRVLTAPGARAAYDRETPMVFRSGAEVLYSDPRAYDPYRDLLSDYARTPLVRAEMEGPAAAAVRLKAVLERVPWCWPARKMLCAAEGGLPSCEASVEAMRAEYFNYF